MSSRKPKPGSQACGEDDDRLTGFDKFWHIVHRSSGWNPVAAFVINFKGRLSSEALIDVFEARLRRYPRLRQRLAVRPDEPAHPAVWKDFPAFSLEEQVSDVTVGKEHPWINVEEAMSEFLNKDWDYDRPLWECMLIGLEDKNAGSTLVLRWHHTVADGLGFAHAILSCTDQQDAQLEHSPSMQDSQRSRTSSIVQLAKRPLGVLAGLRRHLHNLLATVVSAVRANLTVLAAFLEAKAADRRRCPYRDYALGQRVPREDLITISRAFSLSNSKVPVCHLTVNDILAAVIVDVVAETQRKAPHHLLKPRLLCLPDKIALLIPISLRSAGDQRLRNVMSSAAAWFSDPAVYARGSSLREEAEWLRRHLHCVKAELTMHKNGFAAQMLERGVGRLTAWPMRWLLRLAGLVPLPWSVWIASTMTIYHAVFSNMMLPVEGAVSIAGVEVGAWYILPPGNERGCVTFGVVGYHGSLHVAVGTGADLDGNGLARELCCCFEERLRHYVERAEAVLNRKKKDVM